ncbi:MAG: TIGR01459 family HAD-type hydrolase [Hyphomicrobium sp.]
MIRKDTPPSAPAFAPPPILKRAGDLLSRYDVLFCDVWGVLHNGYRAFTAACDALHKFRAKGGTVILVSNAPTPKDNVARMLDACDVPHDVWDDLVASGDIALRYIAEKGYRRVFCVGPRDRDGATFKRVSGKAAKLKNADAILCTGLNDDLNETADDYRHLLEQALALRLPFICANPDLVVAVGGRHYICAGAIADLYERMDGEVFWAGKPHASAYDTALKAAAAIRGKTTPRQRILVIGDSLRTDLKGAEAAGLDAVFVASGIHRDETMGTKSLSPDKLAVLFAPPAPPAIAVMPALAW